MAELASGTVTFLFTDIEGSTQLLKQRDPNGANEAWARIDRMISYQYHPIWFTLLDQAWVR
jgi:class 3 adenylate cyclase